MGIPGLGVNKFQIVCGADFGDMVVGMFDVFRRPSVWAATVFLRAYLEQLEYEVRADPLSWGPKRG